MSPDPTTECSRCGESRLPGSRCKPCRKKSRAAYYVAHREEHAVYGAAYYAAHRNRFAALHAKYRADHRDRIAASRAEYNDSHRKERAAAKAKYRAKHPNRIKARTAIGSAIAAGKKTVGPCNDCHLTPKRVNGIQRIQAHHHRGYAPEHWLDVVWLCDPCHREIVVPGVVPS